MPSAPISYKISPSSPKFGSESVLLIFVQSIFIHCTAERRLIVLRIHIIELAMSMSSLLDHAGEKVYDTGKISNKEQIMYVLPPD
jgi:hypothetical protein